MTGRAGVAAIAALALAGAVSTGCSDPARESEGGPPPGPDVVYVSPAGNDAHPGTPALPKLTLQNAIDSAAVPGEVRVAAGTYRIDDQVTMRDGVSLVGGYSPAFDARDPAAYRTTIADARTPSSGAIHAIYGSGLGDATRIDGFTLDCAQAVSPASSTCVYNRSSRPAITNNVMNGGSGMAANGIHNESSRPTIADNTIRGGTGDTTSGIYNVLSSPVITGNSIRGGGGGGLSYGIYNQFSSSPQVRNNTIHGGSGWYSHGIFNEKSSAPAIVNNTIHGGTGKWYAIGILISDNGGLSITNNLIFTGAAAAGTSIRWCIDEVQASVSNPASVRNNAFFDCPDALYRDEGTQSVTAVDQAVSTAEGTQALASWGNIGEGGVAMFADFANGDLRLRSTAPLNVRGGGLAVPGMATDKDGVARTTSAPAGMTNAAAAGWSLGAYENDD